jgi:hypothetical protein
MRLALQKQLGNIVGNVGFRRQAAEKWKVWSFFFNLRVKTVQLSPSFRRENLFDERSSGRATLTRLRTVPPFAAGR